YFNPKTACPRPYGAGRADFHQMDPARGWTDPRLTGDTNTSWTEKLGKLESYQHLYLQEYISMPLFLAAAQSIEPTELPVPPLVYGIAIFAALMFLLLAILSLR